MTNMQVISVSCLYHFCISISFKRFQEIPDYSRSHWGILRHWLQHGLFHTSPGGGGSDDMSWVEWHGNDMEWHVMAVHHSVHNTQLMISWYLMHSHAYLPITSYVPLGNITWLSWQHRQGNATVQAVRMDCKSRTWAARPSNWPSMTYELRIQDWIII